MFLKLAQVGASPAWAEGSARPAIRPLLIGAAAVVAVIGSGFSSLHSSTPTSAAPAASSVVTPENTQGISAEGWANIQRQMQANQYTIDTGSAVTAENPANKLRAEFGSAGVRLATDVSGSPLILNTLTVNGQELKGQPVVSGAEKNRVERRGDGVSEWYINDAKGLEQGWTIDRPSASHPDTVGIKLQAAGGLQTKEVAGGLGFLDADGRTVFTYKSPVAWDANHRDLPVTLSHNGHAIELNVRAAGAAYPVTVDPLIQVNVALIKVGVQLNVIAGKKVVANDASADNKFGQFVAIDGDFVVVGAVQRNDFTGAAYLFSRNVGGANKYGQVARLVPSDGARRDQFGYSVAIKGTTIAIGAPGKTSNTGAIYVFSALTGAQTKKITVADGVIRDRFGFSVAIDGDNLIAGAPFKNVGAPNPPGTTNLRGAVYGFSQSLGFAQIAEVTEPGGGADVNLFGFAVSLSEGVVIISSDYNQNRKGAAYVYGMAKGTGATFIKMLTASDGKAGDQFGRSVAIDKSSVIVGASGHKIGNNVKQGAAYLFARNHGGTDNFGAVAIVTGIDGQANDYFGRGVAIKQKLLSITLPIVGELTAPLSVVAVGAPGKFDSAGSVYAFNALLSVSLLKLADVIQVVPGVEKFAPDAVPNDQLGFSVALNTDTIVAGAVGVNNGAGAAYIFKSGLVCGLTGTLTIILQCS